MTRAIQGNNSYDSAGIPPKRKRGRPRKDENLYRVASACPRKHKNLPQIENSSAPEHVNPVEDSGSKVGQAIKCVVESVFDAGYVVGAKIGDSNITVRGIVFKPGYYTPVTAKNDVAPHLQMITGSETPQATQNLSHTRQRRPRERHQRADHSGNGTSAHPLPANLLSRRNICTGVVVPLVPVGARGTVVPVVLQPGNAAAAQAAHMAASKGKNVQTVASPSTYNLKLPAPHLSVRNNLP